MFVIKQECATVPEQPVVDSVRWQLAMQLWSLHYPQPLYFLPLSFAHPGSVRPNLESLSPPEPEPVTDRQKDQAGDQEHAEMLTNLAESGVATKPVRREVQLTRKAFSIDEQTHVLQVRKPSFCLTSNANTNIKYTLTQVVQDEKSTRGIDGEGLTRYPYGFWDQVHERMTNQHGHARDAGAWRRLYASLRTKPTHKRDVDIESLKLAVLKHRGLKGDIPWKKITEDPAFSTLFGLNPRVLGDAWASEQKNQKDGVTFQVKRPRH